MIFKFVVFKQKTAYDMRIIDWSSDVCSSDLLHGRSPWNEMNGEDFRQAPANPRRKRRNPATITIPPCACKPVSGTQTAREPGPRPRRGPAERCCGAARSATRREGSPSRYEERREGQGWVSTCNYRRAP